MDNISPEKRSWQMSRVPTKNTKPELVVRRLLFKLGYRYRLHDKNLPGKPDIVFSSRHKAILVHGCFWHRHQNCKYSSMPKSRIEFWKEKFSKTVIRDKKNIAELQSMGWNILTVWTCELNDLQKLEIRLCDFLG
ncbi:MAG: very short patch repair endonuclease [Methylobacter sp.]|jgi:DNA mismatch endonuclease (patch repair protein)